jgi:hypothetical protein
MLGGAVLVLLAILPQSVERAGWIDLTTLGGPTTSGGQACVGFRKSVNGTKGLVSGTLMAHYNQGDNNRNGCILRNYT